MKTVVTVKLIPRLPSVCQSGPKVGYRQGVFKESPDKDASRGWRSALTICTNSRLANRYEPLCCGQGNGEVMADEAQWDE